MRYWDFVVPFHGSSDFLAWVSSVSFQRGYYFFPASNHFSYCAMCENKLILCDHSKYSAVGMRSSSPISGWWPNSPLRFLLLSVHAAFCFCPNTSFMWLSGHPLMCCSYTLSWLSWVRPADWFSLSYLSLILWLCLIARSGCLLIIQFGYFPFLLQDHSTPGTLFMSVSH